jgi:hypothetical protein
MRTLAVCGITFTICVAFVWFCCAFISGIWSPMTWAPVGRFLFVVLVLCFGVPTACAAGMTYDESHKSGC